ncbi:MAG TPA: hypothetical protein VK778_15915 [Solirubrobacteraceae bacterium]|jgi:hypothetical protein|nr:hypothetical protein [Solirubrobacteraceae bacterium]
MIASELAHQDDEQPERASSDDLDVLRHSLRAALNDSAPTRAKTLQAMIDGIRVHARDNIEPTFRIPAVRVDYRYMEPTDLKSNRSARLPGGRMSLDEGRSSPLCA